MNQYTLLHTLALQSLDSLTNLIEKAEAHTKEKGLEESALLNASLISGMFNFTKQVQVATDDARRNICFLAGKEHIKMQDNEMTFAELKERVTKTREVILSTTGADFEGADVRHISLFWMGEAYILGKDFVVQFAIPNLMFHVVTAYDILRAQGVELGKMNFLPKLSMHKGENA